MMKFTEKTCAFLLIVLSTASAADNSRYDINGNDFIDAGDLVIIRQHFNEITSDPFPSYDVNMDGVVDEIDTNAVGEHLGETVERQITTTTISNYDLNINGIIDESDLVIIRQHFNEITDSPYPPYDVNTDGIVDILDATLVGRHIGEVVPSLTISSNDEVEIILANNGNVKGLNIGGTGMPLLPVQGGFSFREVLKTAPNLIINPGFEDGINAPQNWRFDVADGNGNTLVWDTISHSGSRSIKISIPGAINSISGNAMSDLVKSEPLIYYTLSAWGKTEDVTANSVRVVELDVNKNLLRQTRLGFDSGTYDWTRKQITFQTGAGTSYLYVYANIWNGSGTFWIDDIQLSEFFGPSIHLDGMLTQNPDGTITQTTNAQDIDFTFNYIPNDRYIELKGEVRDRRGTDRMIQVMYNLPLNANGWRWGDYIRGSRIINESAHYENIYKIGESRTQSKYPFASIDNNINGLSIAVPMDVPRIYRIGYDLADGYSIQYDFGLSNKTFKIGPSFANFTFVIYKTDEPKWGFRSAAKKYYELYPRFFEKRIKNEGLWFINTNQISLIPNASDFGFAFDESGYQSESNRYYNAANGIFSFIYTEPWGWWRSFGSNPTKPSYDERINALNEDLSSPAIWKNGILIKDISNSVINSAIIDKNGNYYLDDNPMYWHNWGDWMQLYPTNPDPNIPSPNRFDTSYKEYTNSLFNRYITGLIDNWIFGDNSTWDSSISHDNSGHSAKISLSANDNYDSSIWKSDYILASPNTEYNFSGWIKTENVSGGKPAIRLAELDNNNIFLTQNTLIADEPNSDWVFKNITFKTNPGTSKIYVYTNIWKGNGIGWFDDISINVKGSSDNLLNNGGFEQNKRGNITEAGIDGLYIDGLLGLEYLENYRKENWEYTNKPLIFGYDSKQPALLNTFSAYEYTNKISTELHNDNKLVMSNIFPYTYNFQANLIDMLGSEVDYYESDEISSYRRTMSYKKTNSNLMQWKWGQSPNDISYNEMNEYIKNEMFYAIFPGIASPGNSLNYWANPDLFERDRSLFVKNIPIIKEISKAGWEPIPYAEIDNHDLKIERYGGSSNIIYYTIRNDLQDSQTGTLTIDVPKLGINYNQIEKLMVSELTIGTTIELDISDYINIPISLYPGDTKVYKIVFIDTQV